MIKCRDIVQEIKVKGFFLYTPEIWSEATSKRLKRLKKHIATLAEEKIQFINEEYFYICRGNPDNVYVHTEGNTSYLKKGS